MLYSGKMQSMTKIHIQYGRNMHLLTLNFSIINITDEPYNHKVITAKYQAGVCIIECNWFVTS